MFGYLTASEQDLAPAERQRYQAHYCGICRAIGSTCGQRCRATLNHDLVFLALLHGSLNEPAEAQGDARCLVHPVRSHPFLRSSCTDYAARLNVALAYHKLLDDWHDDASVPARLGARVLQAPYRRIRTQLPRQCETIESGLAAISEVERTPDAPPDEAAALFGRIMGELFVDDPQSVWASELYALGERLGRFIYLMDALCDLEQDVRRGSYNPLAAMQNASEVALPTLQTLAGQAAAVFERLPLERDLHLLRSVLYAGIWSRWNAQAARQEQRGQRNATRCGKASGPGNGGGRDGESPRFGDSRPDPCGSRRPNPDPYGSGEPRQDDSPRHDPDCDGGLASDAETARRNGHPTSAHAPSPPQSAPSPRTHEEGDSR